MSTLVTGATGLLGNNIVRLLLERGETVRVLVRKQSSSRPLEGLNVEIAQGDVCDQQSVEQACRGAQRVVHCAGEVHIGWRGLDRQRAINVEGTRHVADAARRAGSRMVHVSSVDALGVRSLTDAVDESGDCEGTVLCPYVVTKREAEQVVRAVVAAGLDAVIVNPGFMLGPWDWKPSSGRMLLELSKGWCLLAPPGTNTYCDVRDVAAGVLSALERGATGRSYVMAGTTHNFMEAWRIMAPITGRRPPLKVGRRVTLRMVGRIGDLCARLTGKEGDVNSAALEMSMLPKNYSSARAAAELGYATRGLQESATDAWAWLKQYGYVR